MKLHEFRSRSGDLLKTFHEYGPLSIRGLMQIVSPKMSKRGLQKVTQKLFGQGLIMKKLDSIPENAGNYFQLRQTLLARTKIGNLIRVDPDKLLQPNFKSKELLHTEACSIWAHRIRQAAPGGIVLRDFQIAEGSQVERFHLKGFKDKEIRPDLVVLLPRKDGKKWVKVAVEIERSRKTARRLIHKLKTFASSTTLDGVLYVCDRNSIAEAVRTIYRSKILDRAFRVKHYGDNFLLLTDRTHFANGNPPSLFNSKLQPASLEKWLHFLLNTEADFRRDENVPLADVRTSPKGTTGGSGQEVKNFNHPKKI